MSALTYKNSKGQTYYLHGKKINLKNDRVQQIYFFARDVREEDAVEELPEGYTISESVRTGMPLLKKT